MLDEILIPTIAQDVRTGAVLMLAYSNRQSLQRTLETGEAHYWSRSRNRLWRKGESSGNIQRFVSASLDCDADTLLFRVEPAGPACHTGAVSCFFTPVREASALVSGEDRKAHAAPGGGTGPAASTEGGLPGGDGAAAAPQPVPAVGDVFARLFEVIESRRRERPEGSYTAKLFEQGVDRISRKIAEEAGEVIIAAKNQSREELLWESADLIYHLMVLLASQGVSWSDLAAELEKRRK